MTNSNPLLYFARNIQVLKQYESPNTWWIEKTKKKKAFSLDKPTAETGLGLQSGQRSTIILTEDYEYEKQKGVNYTDFEKTNKWGLQKGYEMKSEVLNTLKWIQNNPDPVLVPLFYEIYDKQGNFKSVDLTKNNVRKLLKKVEKGVGDESEKLTVMGAKITQETRLDEFMYELTLNELFGKTKKIRNQTLQYLCYKTGQAYADILLDGFYWNYLGNGNDFYTDNHYGNIVIGPNIDTIVEANLVDLGSDLHEIDPADKYKKVAKQHLEATLLLKYDFNTKYPYSPGDGRLYKHFSKNLRKECFSALVMGYKYRMREYGWNPDLPESKIKFPTLMTEEQVRYNIKKVKE